MHMFYSLSLRAQEVFWCPIMHLKNKHWWKRNHPKPQHENPY